MMGTTENLDCLNLVETPVFIVSSDVGGPWQIDFINHAHTRNTGMVLDEVRGIPFDTLFPAGLSEQLQDGYETAFANDAPYNYEETLSFEGVIHKFKTTLRHYSTPSNPDRRRLIGTAQDVTSSANACEQEALQRIELERFMALAAHDLRGPTRRINMIVDELRIDFDDLGDGKIELLDMMQSVAKDTQIYIEKIISYVTASGMSSSLKSVSLRDLATSTLLSLDPTGRTELTVAPDAIRVDPVVIEVILRNLFDNSLKYADTPELKIDIVAREDREGFINIKVSDNGSGFGKRDVFVDRQDSNVSRTGYGLSTIKRISSARGGSAEVGSSVFGQGACLSLTLHGHLDAQDAPAAS